MQDLIKPYDVLVFKDDEPLFTGYRNNFLKPRLSKNGYLQVQHPDGKGGYKNVYCHRLVAEKYIPNPFNYSTVDHKDGDKTNNRVDNLQWMSNKDNVTKAKGKSIQSQDDNGCGEWFPSLRRAADFGYTR